MQIILFKTVTSRFLFRHYKILRKANLGKGNWALVKEAERKGNIKSLTFWKIRCGNVPLAKHTKQTPELVLCEGKEMVSETVRIPCIQGIIYDEGVLQSV